jgi:hypothetical protein
MAKIKIFFLLGIITAVYSSCIVHAPQAQVFNYGHPAFSNDIAYQPKPMSSDSVHHATYISGSYVQGSAPNGKNGNDQLYSGQLNIGQAYTFNDFNLAYGAFGSLGSYSNQTNNSETNPNYFYSKTFGDVGGRFSANAFITTGRVDIRLIGFEMAYTHEFGDYLAFRNSINGDQNFFVNTRSDLVTMGGSTEIDWRSAGHPWEFGVRLFIGQSLGDNRYKNPNALTDVYYPQNSPLYAAFFMQVSRAFFVGEVNSNGGQLRIGLKF